MVVEALLAVILAYLWVGVLEAIDRFERPVRGPEYETATPEFGGAPSFRRTLRIILFFPVLEPSRSPIRPLVKVLAHALAVYLAAWGLARLLDQTMLAIAVVGLGVLTAALFYILTSATRPD